MKLYWPRRSSGLPPGQRLMSEMPRFTDQPHKPPPGVADEPQLKITHGGTVIAHISADDLRALGPRDFNADFHCVTTWSVTGLTWTGVPLTEVFESVGITEAPTRWIRARSADRRRADFEWEDISAADVLLATHLNGEPLDDRHGGPLRLVSPQQYAYKSVKHLISLDFRSEPPQRLGKMHLRARVALEERHPKFPSWLVRGPSRLLIPPTAYVAERTLKRHRNRDG